MTGAAHLRDIVAQNRSGRAIGIPSYCTANPDVLSAIFRAYCEGDGPVLVEATCNQVNQFGGYTGMTPTDFVGSVGQVAETAGLPASRVILGGDHLGPNPWRDQNADAAMQNACDLVAAYVAAGFTKIHLDTSMTCADDETLTNAEIARRATRLCAIAEAQADTRALVYVIGSEVPTPGGETGDANRLAVTKPAAVADVLTLHQSAFSDAGLPDAYRRVIAAVVQPGVDFSNTHIDHFCPDNADALSKSLTGTHVAFEAHSTDYQTQSGLAALVDQHFAILKVGPELTFAYREAIFAMEQMLRSLTPDYGAPVADALGKTMDAQPEIWSGYLAANEDRNIGRFYGLSDRTRYFWPAPALQSALVKLRSAIAEVSIPAGLFSQFLNITKLPNHLADLPVFDAIVQLRVDAVVAKYRNACGDTTSQHSASES